MTTAPTTADDTTEEKPKGRKRKAAPKKKTTNTKPKKSKSTAAANATTTPSKSPATKRAKKAKDTTTTTTTTSTTTTSKSKTKTTASKKTSTGKKSTTTTTTTKKQKTAKSKATAAAAAAAAAATAAAIQKKINSEPPERVLIIDNGGDTVKFGWRSNNNNNDVTTTVPSPQQIPNVTCRLQQQWTVMVGDEMNQIKNPNSIVGLTRSTERGIITNLGNQVQVWKRVLDIMGVSVPLGKNSMAAQAFGWKAITTTTTKTGSNSSKAGKAGAAVASSTKMISPQNCAVLIGLAPFTPRSIIDAICQVWFEDFGFLHVGICISAVCAAQPHPTFQTACVVDLGWSAIHVTPTIATSVEAEDDDEEETTKNETTMSTNNGVTSNTTTKKIMIPQIINSSAIRRVPIGARHLISIWKYYCTYRQWNLMDQDWLLRDVLEQTGYVSLDFTNEMKLARIKPAGRRPFDREFVLPDFLTTFQGKVQIPVSLQREIEKEQQQQKEEEEEDDEDDEDFDENDAAENDIDDDDDDDDDLENVAADNNNNNKNNNDDDDDEEDADSDEEDEEALRKRLLQQREEEERRRREMEAEQQILKITVERFAIPEVLFRPTDAGFPVDLANLPMAIVQAISACPLVYQAALYRSIQMTGGLSKLENLKERLELELRALAPCQYPIQIQHNTVMPSSCIHEAWHGMHRLSLQSPYSKWSISREEWLLESKRGAWQRLLAENGGHLI